MRDRSDFSWAMIVSILLHAGLLVFALVSWPVVKELPIGTVVPVNIVSNSTFTDLRAAVQADKEQTAQVETPAPEAEPQPVPAPQPQPQPKPTPTPPQPQSQPAKPAAKPAPAPAPVPDAKGQKKPAAKPAGLDLDALARSIAKSQPAGGKASSAAKGPNRASTALQERPRAGAGVGNSANALAGLADELQRRWNPNCEVEGGRDVKVRVTFTLGPGGQLVGMVDAGGLDQSGNSVTKAAAERAIRAVHQAAPFSNLPHDFFGQRVTVNFNAREACGG
ncbi:TonB C-terminal domain-containing protein [Phenylobacterium aquaticum]|uniref:TonB C-terminal domain-containing protein n=1 Tax=Phenylobacterium aquaticum TaxID=1763816 RepID=UPI001F5D6E01|nr:TonB C-terminal domain-containing protein [Phenylobacterium aquaticum]MCI3131820.1 TonB C-terminal domain-containing protein [Phenylobacterium aquaticum]